eukprot:CAMPEP_0177646252 /NCGR_PEP_ID=MMETSP0447-20121125/9677_1 /TAXON_ID=0 /ORGANISM="Stygamoeba regulata, Strain BSH-02190019" /LENGTH=147 /DNA_ID=CAMNT_0019148777 /DNA_START=8 /DNA_END=451 /DNA_ORIENTATION=+
MGWKVSREEVTLGGNTYSGYKSLIRSGEQELFVLKRRDSDGKLGIDVNLYDASGNTVGVVRNGVICKSTRGYSVDYTDGDYKLIEDSSGRVVFRVRRVVGRTPLEITGDFYSRNGLHVEVTPDATKMGGTIFSSNTISGCEVALQLP